MEIVQDFAIHYIEMDSEVFCPRVIYQKALMLPMSYLLYLSVSLFFLEFFKDNMTETRIPILPSEILIALV